MSRWSTIDLVATAAPGTGGQGRPTNVHLPASHEEASEEESVRTDQHVTVPVSGMTCDACERRVGKALRALDGVDAVSVSAARGVATVRGSDLPDRDRLEGAIRAAGYEPVAPQWFTRDRTVWRTVAVAVVAVAALAWVITRLGPLDVTSSLMDPSRGGLLVVLALGLAAGVSTCMAMVGGLVLGFSASHAASLAESGAQRPAVPRADATPARVQRRPGRRVRGARCGAGRHRVDDESPDAGPGRAGSRASPS